MDDDLMSLRGSRSGSSNDDDLFGSFDDPGDLGFDAPPPSRSAGADDFDFGDPFGLPDFDQPTISGPAPIAPAASPRSAASPARKAAKRKSVRRTGAKTGFLGMTAQQRMVLSIFMFLDIAVLGLFVLLAFEAIKIPGF
jgi:hypothetical protein